MRGPHSRGVARSLSLHDGVWASVHGAYEQFSPLDRLEPGPPCVAGKGVTPNSYSLGAAPLRTYVQTPFGLHGPPLHRSS